MAASNPTQLGVVGLGRMGENIVRRLMRDGRTCVVFDVNPEAVQALEKEGATGASSVADPALVVPGRASPGKAHAAMTGTSPQPGSGRAP